MTANSVFFWLLFGPISAVVVLAIVGGALLMLGCLVAAANQGLVKMRNAWRQP